METFSFNSTRAIHLEFGGSAKLGQLLKSIPGVATNSQVLLVTDKGIVSLGLHQSAQESLSSEGFLVSVFDDVEADPSETTVLRAVSFAKANDIRVIVGLGGGSSMDVAKLIALLSGSKQNIKSIYGVNQASGTRLPLALVPTTAGTGSEVTPISIVTTGAEEKKGVVSPVLLPDLALLDPGLTLGLPAHITAATGIDAMVHAIEAYTSSNPNNNLMSKMLARQALSLLSENIHKAVIDGHDRNSRSRMLLGSMLAGQAFANSPVAAVHALAYPIGSLFHVPHGLSNAMVLTQVMRFNATHCEQAYAELAPVIYPDLSTGRTNKELCHTLIDRLESLPDELGLQIGLRSVGIQEGDIARLADDAMKQTRLLVNNPRPVSLEDANAIYRQSL